MAEAQAVAPPRTGRHQRQLKNYLLDQRFQLKYAGYFVGIAVCLSLALGLVLWRTSNELLSQSEQVVERGKLVVDEGRKVSKVVEMNIVKDPVYGQDEDLLAAFKEGDQQYTQRLESEQQQLEAQASSLASQHTTASIILGVALLVFVIFVGLAGILVTHKVAGPIFKMKRHLNEVAAGQLKEPSKLRKGDELVDFFESFNGMVQSLRERQEQEVALLEAGIARLEGKASEQDLEPLTTLRAKMKAALD